MKINRMLVTGAAGFIGSNICDGLLERGYEVIALDRLPMSRSKNLEHLTTSKGFNFVEGSILESELLADLAKDADAVIHHAAIASVQRSMEDPRTTNLVNVNGTLEVLLAAKKAGIRKVVFASSSAVYGDTPEQPETEEMTPRPKSVYAVSKLTGEGYCQAFNELFDMRNVSLRYFNVYGPRQDPKSEYAAVIPRFIERALKDEAMTIFGDGRQSRDFIYIEDVVQANLKALESDCRGIFNIGSGRRTTVNELAHLIGKLLGREVQTVHLQAREGDVKDSLAAIEKAAGAFGFAPKCDIEDGLRTTIDWYARKGQND
ncbi:MAG: SDR family oxidoreductase [Methanomassiliicoccales archaeon]|nr:SDR family oxidoreductase [Methanomassiliicoccales archaeon]